VEQGNGRISIVRTMNVEVRQINTRNEQKLAGSSTEEAIRKSYQAIFIPTERKVTKTISSPLTSERANRLNPLPMISFNNPVFYLFAVLSLIFMKSTVT
jgi:hypothetical protein